MLLSFITRNMGAVVYFESIPHTHPDAALYYCLSYIIFAYLNMHVNVANDFTQLLNNLSLLHSPSDDLRCDHIDAPKKICCATKATAVPQ